MVNFPGFMNPVVVVPYQGVSPQSIITLSGVSNFELIPNPLLQKNMKLSYGEYYEHDLTFVKMLLARRDIFKLRSVMEIGEYQQMVTQAEIFTDYSSVTADSFDFGSILKFLKRTAAPALMSIFPQYAPIIGAVSGLISDSASGPMYGMSASGPMYGASASGRMYGAAGHGQHRMLAHSMDLPDTKDGDPKRDDEEKEKKEEPIEDFCRKEDMSENEWAEYVEYLRHKTEELGEDSPHGIYYGEVTAASMDSEPSCYYCGRGGDEEPKGYKPIYPSAPSGNEGVMDVAQIRDGNQLRNTKQITISCASASMAIFPTLLVKGGEVPLMAKNPAKPYICVEVSVEVKSQLPNLESLPSYVAGGRRIFNAIGPGTLEAMTRFDSLTSDYVLLPVFQLSGSLLTTVTDPIPVSGFSHQLAVYVAESRRMMNRAGSVPYAMFTGRVQKGRILPVAGIEFKRSLADRLGLPLIGNSPGVVQVSTLKNVVKLHLMDLDHPISGWGHTGHFSMVALSM